MVDKESPHMVEYEIVRAFYAALAQSVERRLGKAEVTSSILVGSFYLSLF